MADKSATPPGDGFNPPQGKRVHLITTLRTVMICFLFFDKTEY